MRRRDPRVGPQELVVGRDNLARRFEAGSLAKERADVLLLGNRSRNPASGGGGPNTWPVYTTGTLPAAGSGNHRTLVWLKNTSAPEQLLACMQNSDGSYAWTVVSLAPL